MANWELQLIKSIIETKGLRKAVKAGIGPAVFGTTEARASFDYLLAYAARPEHAGEVASEEMFREAFRTVELPAPLQSFEALVEKVKEDHLCRRLHATVASLMEGENSIDNNPYGALMAATEAFRELHASAASVVKVTDFAEEAHDVLSLKYNTAHVAGGCSGMPWPWPELTEKIGGIEPSSMNLLIGIPKAGKTWVALYILGKLWELQARRCLIFSREMSLEQLYARLACIISGMSYTKWQRASFTVEEHALFFAVLEGIKEERLLPGIRRRLVITKGLTNNTTQSLETLRALIDDIEPDVLFLDSAYQLSEDRDWKTLAKLTSGVLQLVSDYPIAGFVTIQDNERKVREGKQGRGTATVAMTPTWMQDCHLAIKVINNDNGYLTLQPIAGRESFVRNGAIRIRFSPADDMGFADYNAETLSDSEGSTDKEPSRPAHVEGRSFSPPTRSGSSVLK